MLSILTANETVLKTYKRSIYLCTLPKFKTITMGVQRVATNLLQNFYFKVKRGICGDLPTCGAAIPKIRRYPQQCFGTRF